MWDNGKRLSSLWFHLGLDLFIYRIYYIIIYYNTLYIIFIDILYNINMLCILIEYIIIKIYTIYRLSFIELLAPQIKPQTG